MSHFDEPKIDYIAQVPQDLMLYVAFGQDLQADLRVLQSAYVWLHGFRICFEIVGESHRVSIEDKAGIVLQEIFACVTLPQRPGWHHQTFDQLQAHHFAQDRYSIDLHFNTTPPQQSLQLAYTFPAMAKDHAMTGIGWQHCDNWLQWWTVHSYPTAQDVLFAHSYSRLDLTKRGKHV